MTEIERINKDVGIAYGDPWHIVLPRVLLWLEKQFAEHKALPPRQIFKCNTCGLLHDGSWTAHPCSNHPRCRGTVMAC